jgi:chromosome segregation ATPase
MSKLRNARSKHEEWQEEVQKLEARLGEVNRNVSELKTKAQNLERAPQSDPEAEQLANSLQILTCLKDVMMPYQSQLLPKNPNSMTREQTIVYHFLNEVQAATARQTPQVEAREPRVWRP